MTPEKDNQKNSKEPQFLPIQILTNNEPHRERRKKILLHHPEIRSLFSYDPSTTILALLCSSCQILIAWHLRQANAFQIALCVLFFGGSFAQLAGEIIHECAHNLAASSASHNKLIGIIVNFTIPIPIAASFAKYHLQHHAFQGVIDKDPDLPLSIEIRLINNGNELGKCLWILFYPVLYVLRGAVLFSGFSTWEAFNAISIMLFDLVIIKVFGWKSFWYLFFSLWFGYSCHPAAAHFIQEHYTFYQGQETYSYYGPLNWLFINIGYHNEHHDFPRIPWSFLPAVNQQANEFYSTLFSHRSWLWVFWEFIFNPCLGPQSRILRQG